MLHPASGSRVSECGPPFLVPSNPTCCFLCDAFFLFAVAVERDSELRVSPIASQEGRGTPRKRRVCGGAFLGFGAQPETALELSVCVLLLLKVKVQS